MKPQGLKSLPHKPGVYLFKNTEGEILYVGKAINLKNRVKSYFQGSGIGHKTQVLVNRIAKIEHIVVESELEALLLEAKLIKQYQPKYNSRLKDDKSFLYIKITDEEIPRVYPSRKEEGGYGPFPKASIVRQILRQVRPIFPYCSCLKTKRNCLFIDLRLCPGPRQGKIELKQYKKTISSLRNLFEGKSQKLITALTKQMNQQAREENYEKAAELRDQIGKLKYLTSSYHPTSQYLENPNLVEDLREEECLDLFNQLKEQLTALNNPPRRIEAFDISNLQGKLATGSMVVFLNGEPNKNRYRRFKIKLPSKPNDIAMMEEVLKRRLQHEDWDLPDLILIDGGKGQVGTALRVLKNLNLNIPTVGLAKREEEIIVQGKNQTWHIKRLDRTSPSLNLLRRIRDEAHRFALAYHRKLRIIT